MLKKNNVTPMTTKELFIKTAEAEKKATVNVLKAVNEDKWDYQPDPKTKKGKDIATLIAYEPTSIANLIRDKKVAWHQPAEPTSASELADMCEKGFDDIKKAAEEITDEDWDNHEVVMKFEGGEWKDKVGNMAFGFLLDLIHHRGQLSVYLRAMGGKVPSIYGPSGDSAQ
jgi:uncharacterized damage-inducible protein DinB